MKRIFTLVCLFMATSLVAQETSKIEAPKVSGYVQGMYTWNEDVSQFSVKRVRVSIKGTITDKFLYTIQTELATPSLVDGFVGYTPCSGFNVKLGQYKVPFSLENTDSSPTGMEFIDYPLGLRILQGLDAVYASPSSFADRGLTAYGSLIKGDGFSVLSYDLGVFNGEGSASDDNKSKDIAFRLIAKPIKSLSVTASYYYGERNVSCDKRSLYTFGVQYKDDKFTVRSEYYAGSSDTFLGEGTVSNSVYALVGYNITSKLNVAARYDTFRLDKTDDQTGQTNYTVGLSYRPIKNVRAMINYVYSDYSATGYDNMNQVAVSVFAMF